MQFHWWLLTVDRYVEFTNWLAELRAEGKIDRIGLTNFNSDATRRILESGVKVMSMQVQYSLLDRR